MLTCITRSNKQPSRNDHTHSKPYLPKSLSSQFKEIVIGFKASGTAHHKGNSAPESWPSSFGRTTTSVTCGEIGEVVFVEESAAGEWVAQVETGVLITFVSILGGGNHLKRIRFSKEMFDKTRAQIWWTANFDRVIELYNVQRLYPHALPGPTPPRSVDENPKIGTGHETPATPPLKECRPGALYPSIMVTETGCSSSDLFERHSEHSPQIRDSANPTPSPKKCSISEAKTDTSSADSCKKISSTREDSLSVTNASDVESEWVVEDEPGVYITIKALSDGSRELKRVRFRRGKFGEMHARVWWEENRSRVYKQYL